MRGRSDSSLGDGTSGRKDDISPLAFSENSDARGVSLRTRTSTTKSKMTSQSSSLLRSLKSLGQEEGTEDKFEPAQVLKDNMQHWENSLGQNYRKHTTWLGTRFKSWQTELHFLNEHSVLNKRTVYAGFGYQVLVIGISLMANAIMAHYNTDLCDEGTVHMINICMDKVGGRDDEKIMYKANAAVIFPMIFFGVVLQWWIHHSKRIKNKAWAMLAVWLIYVFETVGVCFNIVYLHANDSTWPTKLFLAYTFLFLIAVWFAGLLWLQSYLYFIVTATFYYGLSSSMAINTLRSTIGLTIEEEDDNYGVMQYQDFIAMVPHAILVAIVALSSSYMYERTGRIRYLDRLLITFQQSKVIAQKTKSESLQRAFLENMLPASIVHKLHSSSFSMQSFEMLSQRHQSVSILFADIAGFTSFATQVDSSAVMCFLNELFFHFDELCEQFNVYKVETIGDCYVAAVGVVTGRIIATNMDNEEFEGSEDLDRALTLAAITNTHDMLRFAKTLIGVSRSVMKPILESPTLMRVGIHTGPCMSGIVGTRNLRYCLFGDTMNTAARMEQTGVVDAIHVSQYVASLCPEEPWEFRGSVTVKGKGLMDTALLLVGHAESP